LLLGNMAGTEATFGPESAMLAGWEARMYLRPTRSTATKGSIST
jgi:hypothetical protein